MTASITPHLNFRGDAREALAFYGAAFGGETSIVTYTDGHSVADPAEADLVMWGQVENAAGVRVMVYDVQTAKQYDQGVNSYYVSLRANDADEATRYWNGLREGADVEVELGPSFWAPLYGMLKDRFGVVWVVDVEAPAEA